MEKQLKLIIDNVGRFILGEVVGESAADLSLKNPIILHVQPNPQTNQLQVQNIPLLFNEFISDKESNVWTFSKGSIAISNAKLDPRLVSQYFGVGGTTPPPQNDAEVIKLFDD